MRKTIWTRYGKMAIYASEPTRRSHQVVIIPGYSESIAHNKALVEALKNRGIDSFTFDQPRGISSGDPLMRQADVLLLALVAFMSLGEKIHAVAHSLGAAAALKAARTEPARFASLTLMQPIGMVGGQNFAGLARQVAKKVALNQARASKRGARSGGGLANDAAAKSDESVRQHFYRVLRGQLTSASTIARNPVLALKEASAAVRYDFSDDVREVVALGIPVSIVWSHNDEIFETGSIDRKLENLTELAASCSSITDKAARHDTFWIHPERTASIVAALTRQSDLRRP